MASASSSPPALHRPWRQAWVAASVALTSLVSHRVWSRRWRQGTRGNGDREARGFSGAPQPPGHQVACVLPGMEVFPGRLPLGLITSSSFPCYPLGAHPTPTALPTPCPRFYRQSLWKIPINDPAEGAMFSLEHGVK